MDATMRAKAAPHLQLLTSHDVMAITGLSYENVKALMRVHGIKFGRRYYMTQIMLAAALEAKREGKR